MIRKLSLIFLLLTGCHFTQPDEALNNSLQKAEAGNRDVLFAKAILYENSADYKQAAYWYTKAAEQGDSLAQSSLGNLYEKGNGVEQDYRQAAYWYAKAGEQGDLAAQLVLGLNYEKDKDYKQAAYWYAKAAEQGDSVAEFSLGKLYADGKGVAQSFEQAANWFFKSAMQGTREAQFNLGVMYAQGMGLPKSEEGAYIWFSIAAANGVDAAKKEMNISASKLTPATLEEAKIKSAELIKEIEQPKSANVNPRVWVKAADAPNYMLECYYPAQNIKYGNNTYNAPSKSVVLNISEKNGWLITDSHFEKTNNDSNDKKLNRTVISRYSADSNVTYYYDKNLNDPIFSVSGSCKPFAKQDKKF